MGNGLFSNCQTQTHYTTERWIINKLLVCINLILALINIWIMIVVYLQREMIFQVRSKILIWSLWLLQTLTVSLHYGANFNMDTKTIFVIAQEFIKIWIFMYAVYFYLKHAIDFTIQNGKKYIFWIKLSIMTFLTLLSLTMLTWVILRETKVITTYSWRDYVWLIFRLITTILIITIIIVGIKVQKTVERKFSTESLKNDLMKSTDSLINPSNSEAENSHGRFAKPTNNVAGKYYLTSSAIRNREAIKKSLHQMWFWFSVIIFVCILDLAYNIFWITKNKDIRWDDFVHDSDVANAIIFLVIRSISLSWWIPAILFWLIRCSSVMAIFTIWWPRRGETYQNRDSDYSNYE